MINISNSENVKFYNENKLKEKNNIFLEEYAKTKSKELRDKIIIENLPVVKYYAKRISEYYDVPYDDLYQVGSIGLFKSVIKFNIDYKKSFESYSKKLIICAMFNEIANGDIDSISTNFPHKALRIKKDIVKLEKIYEKKFDYNDEDMMNHLISILENDNFIKKSKKEDFMTRIHISKPLMLDSLDEYDIEERTIKNEDNIKLLNDIIAAKILTKFEKEFLFLRYGINDGIYKTLYRTSVILNQSRKSLCKIEKRAFNKIRNYLNSKEYNVTFNDNLFMPDHKLLLKK